jgi:hypothetical protein
MGTEEGRYKLNEGHKIELEGKLLQCTSEARYNCHNCPSFPFLASSHCLMPLSLFLHRALHHLSLYLASVFYLLELPEASFQDLEDCAICFLFCPSH